MNKTYQKLLLESAERGVYKRRPIDLLNEVERIKRNIEADKLAGKNVKIKTMEASTPIGQAISKAKIKSGKKAFQKQMEQQKFDEKFNKLKRSGASESQIQELYKKEFEIQKLMKELPLLEDEPAKYLAKLQELEQLQQSNTVETLLKEQTSQLKSQNTSLQQLIGLYGELLTPSQLLESLPQFQDLDGTEKKIALKNLQKQIPRNRAKQKLFIKQILEQPDDVIEELKQGIKISVPIKANAEEIPEDDNKYKNPYDLLDDDEPIISTTPSKKARRKAKKAIAEAEIEEEAEKEIHPQLEQLIPTITEHFQNQDADLTQAEAEHDANQIVEGVTEDLQQSHNDSFAQAVATELPLSDNEENVQQSAELSPPKTRSGRQRQQLSISKKSKGKGKGFTPLENYPQHLIAGSLANHLNRVRNKRRLMKVTLHHPFDDTENEEYRKNLTQQTIKDVKGGGIFGSFLAGLTAPFRVVSDIIPGPWTLVAKAADALKVPTIADVVKG